MSHGNARNCPIKLEIINDVLIVYEHIEKQAFEDIMGTKPGRRRLLQVLDLLAPSSSTLYSLDL